MAAKSMQKASAAPSVKSDGRDESNATARRSEGVFAPPVDVVETDEEFVMYADMPGVKAEDVSLHCKDGQLVLHARCAPRGVGRRPLHREYGVGDFYRTFTLTDQIDAGWIDARLENGVLVLTLPKAEKAKPKRIAVKGA
jgi:HSP20 family protein